MGLESPSVPFRPVASGRDASRTCATIFPSGGLHGRSGPCRFSCRTVDYSPHQTLRGPRSLGSDLLRDLRAGSVRRSGVLFLGLHRALAFGPGGERMYAPAAKLEVCPELFEFSNLPSRLRAGHFDRATMSDLGSICSALLQGPILIPRNFAKTRKHLWPRLPRLARRRSPTPMPA